MMKLESVPGKLSADLYMETLSLAGLDLISLVNINGPCDINNVFDWVKFPPGSINFTVS